MPSLTGDGHQDRDQDRDRGDHVEEAADEEQQRVDEQQEHPISHSSARG